MLPFARLALALLAVVAAPAVAAQGATPDVPPEVVDWIRLHAVPLAGAAPALPDDDLDALLPMLGDARVLGIGEGTHGTREFFQFRDRVLRWLARRGELDAVLWETALAHSVDREAAVADPAVAVTNATLLQDGPWNTEESLAMLTALRAHNLAASRPVRFVGADTSPNLSPPVAIAVEAARRVGGDARSALAVMTDALGADLATACADRGDCDAAWMAMTPDRARLFAEGADWLADALDAAGEPWTVTIPARAVGDVMRWSLPFLLMPASAPDAPLGQAEDRLRQAQEAAQAAADTLAAVLGERDPTYWATVAAAVAALPGGADVYRDSLSRAERFEWDQTARALRARLATGRYGKVPQLGAAADALVAWLDLMHESLRRPATDMDVENYREVAMGRNVAQIARAVGGDGRVVFAAHNPHVGYNPSITLARTPSGAFARRALGDDYLAIGTFFGTGRFQAYDVRADRDGWDGPAWRAFETDPPAGSVEAAMTATGLDAFALDLRQIPTSGPVADWFRQPRPARNVGNSYDPDHPDGYVESSVLPDGFDVAVFFRHADRAVTTAAQIQQGSYDLGE